MKTFYKQLRLLGQILFMLILSLAASRALAQQCNWYGTLYPLCDTTTTGWGWENSQSCISISTCSAQPSPYGIVGDTSSSQSSSSSSSSACQGTTITPYAQVNGGSWQQTGSVNLSSGDTVTFGPHPTSGSWNWEGCSTGGTSREQTISPNSSCQATARYTNSCGAITEYTHTVTVSGSSSSSSSSSSASECGSGTPDARVTGSPGNYQINGNPAGSSYFAAISSAVNSVGYGQRVTVDANGAIGDNSIDLPSGITFEVCGTMDVGNVNSRGAVQAIGRQNVSIPHLKMTGSPYFGLRFGDVDNLHLGQIDLRLNGGLGIRFERDLPGSSNVTIDYVYVSGTGNHGVETWNIDGLEIGTVVARDVAYAGLLLNNTRNATIGLVDGDNVATGTGYATLRFANENGRINGGYPSNIYVESVISRGGGRGLFCVSNSGGAEINRIDFANNGNNSILIENCHNVRINGGQIRDGGEVRLSARDEFPNNSDITISNITILNTNVRESPCGNNINWVNLNVQGGSLNICN
ncbi:carbohydrate-binding domain-containing protein [Teredinibacter haidensis]|uniref:carbohydrate-binding domain-containing protein n=1 Tax=Teredinibacter haidensis TaxID=2731755 RepID=UPI0009F85B92|nr:carbohydrate-binding domain-containing protein [Teredinibacter haidensis]